MTETPPVIPPPPESPAPQLPVTAAPSAPPAANPHAVARWKRALALITSCLLIAVVAVAVVRIVRPPPPQPKQHFIPVRVMGAAPPQNYSTTKPRPLGGAVVRFETLNEKNEIVGPAQEIATDAMGAANIQYTPGFALHIQITAPDFAERDMWMENPRQFALDTPDFIMTLDRAYTGPRNLPLFVVKAPADAGTPLTPTAPQPPDPLAGIAVAFQYDPADPTHPETPDLLTTRADGMVMLKFLPGRGATVRIQLPGYAPFEEHYIDSYDYERLRPSAIVELQRNSPAPQPQP